jgi:hypothetical protein
VEVHFTVYSGIVIVKVAETGSNLSTLYTIWWDELLSYNPQNGCKPFIHTQGDDPCVNS